tara:strand:- start:696 stop:1307 length:612 start_codon:yes stop_codon:yes gene_type:complete
MIKDLVKLANELDSKGLVKEADYLDRIIVNASNRKTYTSHYDDDGRLLSTEEWKLKNPPPSEEDLVEKYNLQSEEDVMDSPQLERELHGMYNLYQAQLEKNKSLHLAEHADRIREDLQQVSEHVSSTISSGGQPDTRALKRMHELSRDLKIVQDNQKEQDLFSDRANQAVHDDWYDSLSPDRQQYEDYSQARHDLYELHRNQR